jgi:hypothetical protein
MRGMIGVGVAVAVAFVMGCGGSRSRAPAAATPSAAASAPGGSSAPTAGVGASPASAPRATVSGTTGAPPTAASAAPDARATLSAAGPGERPFARSALEAQQIIESQIDAHSRQLWACVNDYRAKKKAPHKEVVVAIGIDEEGNLLGITSANGKHGLDETLKQCLFSALHGLPFPRSHAGVITVKQSFNDVTVYTP